MSAPDPTAGECDTRCPGCGYSDCPRPRGWASLECDYDPTAGEHGCRWSASRGRWETVLRPGVSKEACGHLSHTRGDEIYLPDEPPCPATPDADDASEVHVIEERGRIYDRCRCGWYGTLGDTHVAENTDTSEPLTEAEREALNVAIDEAETCVCCGDHYGSKHVYAAAASIKAAAATKARADERRAIRFRVETACEGYENLVDDDVPSDVVDAEDYARGAADAARAIRGVL